MRKNLLIAFSAMVLVFATAGDHSNFSRNDQHESGPVIVAVEQGGQSGNIAKGPSRAPRHLVARDGQSGNVAMSSPRA